MMALGMVALMGGYLLLDKYMPLLRQRERQGWLSRLSLWHTPRTDP